MTARQSKLLYLLRRPLVHNSLLSQRLALDLRSLIAMIEPRALVQVQRAFQQHDPKEISTHVLTLTASESRGCWIGDISEGEISEAQKKAGKFPRIVTGRTPVERNDSGKPTSEYSRLSGVSNVPYVVSLDHKNPDALALCSRCFLSWSPTGRCCGHISSGPPVSILDYW
jgi:hypothetical protein